MSRIGKILNIGTAIALYQSQKLIKHILYHMKKVLLSAMLLTGVMAMAQEKPAQAPAAQPAQTTQTATTTATKEVKPAAQASTPATAQPAQTATVQKTEATVKQEKVQTKKADPAKKSK